jgi:hypothetical protein
MTTQSTITTATPRTIDPAIIPETAAVDRCNGVRVGHGENENVCMKRAESLTVWLLLIAIDATIGRVATKPSDQLATGDLENAFVVTRTVGRNRVERGTEDAAIGPD